MKPRETPAMLNAGFESIRPAEAARWVVEAERLQTALHGIERDISCAVPAESSVLDRWAAGVADELATTTLDKAGELARVVEAVKRAGHCAQGFQHELKQLHIVACKLFSVGDVKQFQKTFSKLSSAPDSNRLATLRAEQAGLAEATAEHNSRAVDLFPGANAVPGDAGMVALTGDPATDSMICAAATHHWGKLWRSIARVYGSPVTWTGTLIASISDDRRKQFEVAFKTLGCKPAANREQVIYLPIDSATGRLCAYADPRCYPS